MAFPSVLFISSYILCHFIPGNGKNLPLPNIFLSFLSKLKLIFCFGENSFNNNNILSLLIIDFSILSIFTTTFSASNDNDIISEGFNFIFFMLGNISKIFIFNSMLLLMKFNYLLFN